MEERMTTLGIIFPEEELIAMVIRDVLKKTRKEFQIVKQFSNFNRMSYDLDVLEQTGEKSPDILIVPLGGRKFCVDNSRVIDLYFFVKDPEFGKIKLFIINDSGMKKQDEAIMTITKICDGIIHIPFSQDDFINKLREIVV
jgi:hypothetical protein